MTSTPQHHVNHCDWFTTVAGPNKTMHDQACDCSMPSRHIQFGPTIGNHDMADLLNIVELNHGLTFYVLNINYASVESNEHIGKIVVDNNDQMHILLPS